MKGRRVIETPDDLTRLIAFLGDFPMPYTVTTAPGKGRTLSQNAMVHVWFAQVANHFGDRDMLDVKGDCNVTYGIPILVRDDEVYGRFIERLNMNREQLVYACKRGFVPVTRLMNTKQMSEYMDMMGRDYRGEGVMLTDPELLKYQDVAA